MVPQNETFIPRLHEATDHPNWAAAAFASLYLVTGPSLPPSSEHEVLVELTLPPGLGMYPGWYHVPPTNE